MHPGRDLVCILEGRVWGNRAIISHVLHKFGWRCRPVALSYHEGQWQDLVNSGTRTKRSRKHVGVGTMCVSDTLYFCYKGKMPTSHETTHKYINPGSSVASNVWSDIPVVKEKDMAWVKKEDRAAVLAGSTFECSGRSESSEEEDGEIGDSPSSQRAKRNQALVRVRTTDEVPMFSHPTSPEIVKELIHIFHPQWMFTGTPEGGVSIKAAMDLRVPTMAWSRNQRHAELLVETLVNVVAVDVTTPGKALFYQPISDMLQSVLNNADSESSLDDSEDDQSVDEHARGPELTSDLKKDEHDTDATRKRKTEAPGKPEKSKKGECLKREEGQERQNQEGEVQEGQT